MADLVNCKACGKEIAKGVKKCPHCGKDQRNWFMRHKILTFIGAIVLLIALGNALGGGDDTATNNDNTAGEVAENQEEVKEEAKEPIVVTVDELMDTLNENALKASKTYEDQYVEVRGRLSNIDSSGDYFSLDPLSEEFTIMGVQCFIEEKHLDAVMEFSSDQEVTVVGTITDVGEVMGYHLDVESIK
ncbi:OB-fold protein [Ferdinandcohnia sp. Marseille-Q9671]